MAKIPFTDKELARAWRESLHISKAEKRLNPHRLLLFYAIECGLKAVYLQKKRKDIIDSKIADEFSHDINKMCSKIIMSDEYHLPEVMNLKDCIIDKKSVTRRCHPGEINQVWRYGGKLYGQKDDSLIERKLEKINEWISKELMV